MKTSTNALTKRFCALQGWPCETVQSWRGKIRHDLFGIADSIVLIDDKALWVQNCSYGSLKQHRDEIDRSPHLAWVDRSMTWLELWEWRKKKASGSTSTPGNVYGTAATPGEEVTTLPD